MQLIQCTIVFKLGNLMVEKLHEARTKTMISVSETVKVPPTESTRS